MLSLAIIMHLVLEKDERKDTDEDTEEYDNVQDKLNKLIDLLSKM